MENPNKNETRSMTDFSYDSQRFDKSKELNESMTINPQSFDEYGRKTRNVNNSEGGNE